MGEEGPQVLDESGTGCGMHGRWSSSRHGSGGAGDWSHCAVRLPVLYGVADVGLSGRGLAVRIFLVSGSRFLGLFLSQALAERALLATVASLEVVLAAWDRPVILYHAPRWEAQSQRVVEQLAERTDRLFVVCPDVLRPAVRLALAERGARDGFADDRASLRLLALQVERLCVQELSLHLVLGPLVLDVLQGTLCTSQRWCVLTAAEVRLLVALWPRGVCEWGDGGAGGSPRGACWDDGADGAQPCLSGAGEACGAGGGVWWFWSTGGGRLRARGATRRALTSCFPASICSLTLQKVTPVAGTGYQVI